MSYDVDELFSFRKKVNNGYALEKYLKRDDPTVTDIDIPAEYNGKPITEICYPGFCNSKYIKRVVVPPSVCDIAGNSFYGCSSLENVEFSEGLEVIGTFAFRETKLKSIVLPKSLNTLYWGAFRFCRELERVELNSAPIIELNVFSGCPKLPPETVIMGLVRSTDITTPIESNVDLITMTEKIPNTFFDCFRRDVFELLAKNDCFRNCDLRRLFERMTDENRPALFPAAEKYGMLENAELLDDLINYAAESQSVECTAYLLDLKSRKFGFEGGSNFEL